MAADPNTSGINWTRVRGTTTVLRPVVEKARKSGATDREIAAALTCVLYGLDTSAAVAERTMGELVGLAARIRLEVENAARRARGGG